MDKGKALTMTNAECDLANGHCVPCRGGVPPLTGADLDKWVGRLDAAWALVDEHHLERAYAFKNFRTALAFTNAVGEIAEAEGHHPELVTTWGRVTVRIWTHKINGLTESDFILAAKVDRAYAAGKSQAG